MSKQVKLEELARQSPYLDDGIVRTLTTEYWVDGVDYCLTEEYSVATEEEMYAVSRVSSEDFRDKSDFMERSRHYAPFVEGLHFENLSLSRDRVGRKSVSVTNSGGGFQWFELSYKWGELLKAYFEFPSGEAMFGRVWFTPPEGGRLAKVEFGSSTEEETIDANKEHFYEELAGFPCTFNCLGGKVNIEEKEGIFQVAIFNSRAEKKREISFPKSLGKILDELFDFEKKEWINAPKLLRIKYEEFSL